jgi:hypothetical protein
MSRSRPVFVGAIVVFAFAAACADTIPTAARSPAPATPRLSATGPGLGGVLGRRDEHLRPRAQPDQGAVLPVRQAVVSHRQQRHDHVPHALTATHDVFESGEESRLGIVVDRDATRAAMERSARQVGSPRRSPNDPGGDIQL